jgi:hypothetical protein
LPGPSTRASLSLMPHHLVDHKFIVTGPSSRLSDTFDPDPSVEKLKAAGMWRLASLDPLVAHLVELAYERRMGEFPLHSDASMVMTSGPALGTNLATTLQEANQFTNPELNLERPVMVRFGEEYLQDPDHIRWTAEMMQRQVRSGVKHPSASPLWSAIEHEAFHPVVTALLSLPGVREHLESELGRALGQSFSFDDLASRSAVAELLGSYGGNGVLGEPEHPVDSRFVMDEMGAEALSVARHLGESAPGVAHVWWNVATELLGRDSPVSVEINRDLLNRARVYNYFDRTAPDATGWRKNRAPESLAMLDHDPGRLWELRNPDTAGPAMEALMDEVFDRQEAGELQRLVAAALERAKDRPIAPGGVQIRAGKEDDADLKQRAQEGEPLWPLSGTDQRVVAAIAHDPLVAYAMRAEAELMRMRSAEVEVVIEEAERNTVLRAGAEPQDPTVSRRRRRTMVRGVPAVTGDTSPTAPEASIPEAGPAALGKAPDVPPCDQSRRPDGLTF